MRGALLFAAGLFTGLAVQVALAQNANRGVVMMNHVGINVPNIDEAVKYYTEKMGYKEAFRVFDEKKQPRLVYMQISKNTFLELNPANAQRPAGFTPGPGHGETGPRPRREIPQRLPDSR